MGTLSEDLKDMGYERTEQESPFEDGGVLWSDGTELVCDETGVVIRSSEEAGRTAPKRDDYREERFRYPNSEKVRMIGGFFSAYDWGRDDDGRFFY